MRLFSDKKTARRCHIYTMLKKNEKKHLSFHTPGHKIGRWDITELSYSDNLSAPRGCIAAAEKDVAALLGAKRSFLLTDGSTAGVSSALYAARALGARKIAFSLNSHKSVWNGCALLGLSPLVFEGEDIYEKAAACDALLITSPTYYGEVADLKKLRVYCDENGKLLLVDGAHGGHLHFNEELYAGRYADIWVDGVHKSLPALTQGAVVSARTEKFAEALRKGVEIFRTSSPSYPIMASVEYAVKYPRNHRLENAAREFMQSTDRVKNADDWTKIIASFGANAFAAARELEEKGIYPEFCDGNAVVFYLSPATTARAFRRLKRELKKLFEKYPYEGENRRQLSHTPFVFPQNAKTELVDLQEAGGKICGKNCGLFPPCTPLLFAGERITEEKLALLKNAPNLYGVVDGKISIITEEEV